MLKRLNEVNDVVIRDVNDPVFASYGRVVKGLDVRELTMYMENHTDIPENGNVYIASVPAMESFDVRKEIE